MADKTLEKIKMPVVFIGHGSPMNAIENNEFTRSWEEIAYEIPKPRLILCISAHWETEKTLITAMEQPTTIHDFYGFPEKLYRCEYNAKGSPKEAEAIIKKIKSVNVGLDHEWGLDHGAWSVLVKMYPKADIPVLQLSLDYNLPLEKHFQIGKELAKLREENILIIGSGNIVHNLGLMRQEEPYNWAIEFDDTVKKSILKKDYSTLIDYKKHASSRFAVPTNEHYLPLLYAVAASGDSKPTFYNEKIFYGSLSMRCIVFI